MEVAEAKRAEIMARAHSQGQLICWDEDDDHGIEDIGTGDIGTGDVGTRDVGTGDIGDKGHTMTDSSDSFICINEEIMKDEELAPSTINKDSEETNNIVVIEKEPLPPDGGGNDSDWEKWDDND